MKNAPFPGGVSSKSFYFLDYLGFDGYTTSIL